MATGKHTSLEEARKKKQLKRFMEEHPSEGDEEVFDKLLGEMAKKKPEEAQTSEPDSSED